MKTKDQMRISESAFTGIINFIAARPAESGGALFGSEKDYIIREFIPDLHAETTKVTYNIDAMYINRKIQELWDEKGYSLLGFCHSHPQPCPQLSGPDMAYFSNLLKKIERKKFYAPIVHCIPDGGYKMYPYVLNADGTEAEPAQLEIVPDDIPTGRTNLHKMREQFKRLGHIRQSAVMQMAITGLKLFFLVWAIWLTTSLSPAILHSLIKLISNGTK